MSISSLDELLILEEGERFVPYDDMTGEAVPVGGVCLGTLTAGVGHTGSDVKPGDYWTRERSRATLAQDRDIALARAAKDLGPGYFRALDPVRQAALASMAFAMGGKGLAGFHRMLTAVRSDAWQVAHDECLASDWARMEEPARAKRCALMLLTGQWPQ